MVVTHLPAWGVTAIEIALDLEQPLDSGLAVANFDGPAEPRICLITCFALTSQLRRIVMAVDRVLPSRLPAVRIAPVQLRCADTHRANAIKAAGSRGVAIAPMVSLLRLQQRVLRAIEPGLGDQQGAIAAPMVGLDQDSARFVGNFIRNKTLPTFEPPLTEAEFSPARLRVTGITIFCLGRHGAPRSVLAHWAYSRSARGSIHLRSGV